MSMTLSGDNGVTFPDSTTKITNANPQVTVYTSGSGTYTVPTNAKYLFVQMVGGGGGGSGGGPAGTGGGTGGNTTFGTSFLTCNGGQVLTPGAASGGDINITGGSGQYPDPYINEGTGQQGGNSFFGGAGGGIAYQNGGTNAAANSGSGGAGGSSNSTGGATSNSGVSGGAGGYLAKTIVSPNATYSYAVGAGGTGGTKGGGVGGNGGAGGAGVIYITAYF